MMRLFWSPTPLRSATIVGTLGLASLLLRAPALTAQPTRTDPVDAQAWYGAKLNIDLPNKWESAVEYRLRYQNNAQDYLGSYVTTDLGRTLNKHWALSGSYRLALVDAATYHRVAVGGTWDQSVRRTKVSVRGLVQYQRQTFEGNDETGGDEDTFVRLRAQLRRTVRSGMELYLSSEPYLKFGANYPVDNWRNTMGTKWALGGGRSLDLFYIYRPDYGKRSYNRTFHVVGAQFEWGWKPLAKTKKAPATK